MKKFFSLILIISLLLSSTLISFAENSTGLVASASVEGLVASISGETGVKEVKTVNLLLYKPGCTVPEADEGNLLEFTHTILSTKTDSSGKFSFPFKFKNDSVSGEYTAVINTDAQPNNFIEVKFYYVNQGMREQITDYIENAETSQMIFDYINQQKGIFESLGFKISRFQNLSSDAKRLNVCQKMTTESGFNSDYTKMVALLNKHTAVEAFNDATLEQFTNYIQSYNDVYQLPLEDEDFINNKTDVINLFYNRKPFLDVTLLRTAYRESVSVAAVNAASWGYIPDLLTKYSDVFIGLNTSDYDKLTAKKKISVCMDVADTNLTTCTDVVRTYNAAVLKYTETDGGNGGNGGGGGGGGTSYVKTPVVPVTPPPVIPPVEVNNPLPDNQNTDVQFTDINDVPWAVSSIEALTKKGVVSDSTQFYPDNNVTREEFIKMLVVAFDIFDETAECDFADVPADSWAYKYVASAKKAGITNGIDENNFGTGRDITRQDAAVLLKLVADKKLITLPEKNEEMSFADNSQISEYAVDAVTAMQKAGVLNGFEDGTFGPNANCTRAQAAVLFYGMLSFVE